MKKGLIIRIFISITVLAMVLPITAFGQSEIEVDRDSGLEIIAEADDDPVSGMHFDVYKMADVNSNGVFSVTEKFRKYVSFIDFSEMGGEKGAALASTIKPYIETDGMAADLQGDAGEDGILSFTVKPGMYLVIGRSVFSDDRELSVQPFLVMVPEKNESDNSWNYNVRAYPKCEWNECVSEIIVSKIWSGSKKTHPDEVTAVLQMKNGEKWEAVESVKLNDSNNWKYEWKDLSLENEWLVLEENVPSDYYVTIENTDHGFVITNKSCGDPSDPGVTPHSGGTGGKTKLPQTGLLWWPVFALAGAGLVLIIIGIIRRNRAGEK